jgi:NDP-sugar pyrophosphorylase family protein
VQANRVACVASVDALRVIIPVGGEAQRLRPLTTETSKAVVRLFNRPIVEFALASLALQGVRNFVFGVRGYVNYKSLFDYFKEGTGFSARYGISPRVHVRYQPPGEDVGSADSVRINMDYFAIEGPVMVVQGDNLFEFDLADFLHFHEAKQSLLTVALTRVTEVERYGIAELTPEGRIVRFVEKPEPTRAPSNLASTGIYLLSPEVKGVYQHPAVQAMIAENKRLDFGLDFIPFLVAQGYPVYAYVLEGAWYDVGTPDEYLRTMLRGLRAGGQKPFRLGEPAGGLNSLWIQGEAAEALRRKNEILRKVRDGKIALEGSVYIGRHCQLGDGILIRDSCLDNFCVVGERAVIERSAIMDRVIVGEGAEISDSIVARHVSVGSSRAQPTRISDVSVIGDNANIHEGCSIVHCKVFPHKVLSAGTKIVNATLH